MDAAQQVLEARAAVEHFVRGRTSEDAEDIVQEAVTRLLENSHRLEPSVWASYAVVVAGRLLRDRQRASDVRRRLNHLTPTPARPKDPLAAVLSEEEHAALRRAVARLPDDDGQLLRTHYVDNADAPSNRNRPRGTTAKLSRARAKLRVAYLLEHASVKLPTTRCRPVLEALSTGDSRRQERTGASRHLLACRTCSSYAEALVARRRHLVGVHPLAWVTAFGTTVWAAARQHPKQAATATAGGIVLVAAVGLTPALSQQPPIAPTRAAAAAAPASSPPRAAPSKVLSEGRPLLPLDSRPVVGNAVTGSDVQVLRVPADEGFWIDDGTGRRLWVQLSGPDESPVRVRVGDRVSFRGVVIAVDDGFATRVGVRTPEGRRELEAARVYASVPVADLAVR